MGFLIRWKSPGYDWYPSPRFIMAYGVNGGIGISRLGDVRERHVISVMSSASLA